MAKKKMALNRIKEVLAKQGKTQTWLSAELDVDFNTVNRWCGNTAQPSLETLFKLAKALKVSPKELLNG